MSWKFRRYVRRKKKAATNQVSPLHPPLPKGTGEITLSMISAEKPKRVRKKPSSGNVPLVRDNHGE